MSKNIATMSYTVFVVLVSAALALSLPFGVSAVAEHLPASWALIENEPFFLVAIEIFTAVALIVFFTVLRNARNDRKLARMAKSAGLVPLTTARGIFPHACNRKLKRIKDGQAFGRAIMIIGSTGYRSFARPEGDLHAAMHNCREARIMLLDPREHGAIARAQSIPDPEITPEVIRGQITKSIEFMKGLQAHQKIIRLKLYPDMPLLKLAILGVHAYVRHYHTGLNVRFMPEFAFKNIEQHGGLYMPLYRYFLSRWQDPDIPEYDFDSDELIYRDQLGYEVLREPFNEVASSDDVKETDEENRPGYVFR